MRLKRLYVEGKRIRNMGRFYVEKKINIFRVGNKRRGRWWGGNRFDLELNIHKWCRERK
jgi:hypothetical protein